MVVSSQEVNCYYYMDEAGIVPDREDEFPVPDWGVDIKCGKGTDFSYGPWADRQRELIFKFFFPQVNDNIQNDRKYFCLKIIIRFLSLFYQDFQPMLVTQKPRPGEKRQAKDFVLRLSTEYESTMDILFSKLKETSAVHVTIGQGTNFELRIPW